MCASKSARWRATYSVVRFGLLDLGAEGGRVRHRADGGGQVAGHRGVLLGFGADPVSPRRRSRRRPRAAAALGAAPPVPLGFRLRVIRQQPLTEGVIQRAAVVKIAHDPASGSGKPGRGLRCGFALGGPGGLELADQRHDVGSDLVVSVGGRAGRGYDADLAAGRAGPRCRHLRPGAGLRRQVLRSLGQAEDVEQQPAFMLAGPVPPRAGQGLGRRSAARTGSRRRPCTPRTGGRRRAA